jgi:hypothetical protein
VSTIWNCYRKCRLVLLNFIYKCSNLLHDEGAEEICQDHLLKEAHDLSESLAASILFTLTQWPCPYLCRNIYTSTKGRKGNGKRWSWTRNPVVCSDNHQANFTTAPSTASLCLGIHDKIKISFWRIPPLSFPAKEHFSRERKYCLTGLRGNRIPSSHLWHC